MSPLRHPAKTVVPRSLMHRGPGPARLTARPGQALHGRYSSKAISKARRSLIAIGLLTDISVPFLRSPRWSPCARRSCLLMERHERHGTPVLLAGARERPIFPLRSAWSVFSCLVCPPQCGYVTPSAQKGPKKNETFFIAFELSIVFCSPWQGEQNTMPSSKAIKKYLVFFRAFWGRGRDVHHYVRVTRT
jgi:hypothetical protein